MLIQHLLLEHVSLSLLSPKDIKHIVQSLSLDSVYTCLVPVGNLLSVIPYWLQFCLCLVGVKPCSLWPLGCAPMLLKDPASSRLINVGSIATVHEIYIFKTMFLLLHQFFFFFWSFEVFMHTSSYCIHSNFYFAQCILERMAMTFGYCVIYVF